MGNWHQFYCYKWIADIQAMLYEPLPKPQTKVGQAELYPTIKPKLCESVNEKLSNSLQAIGCFLEQLRKDIDHLPLPHLNGGIHFHPRLQIHWIAVDYK